jgi:hypothetical protein
MKEDTNYFVCGGLYGDPPNQEFKFVSQTTGTLPYVCEPTESRRMFRLCMHHSSLYQINRSFTKIRKEEQGEGGVRDVDPQMLDLTPVQSALLRAAAEHPWMVDPPRQDRANWTEDDAEEEKLKT